MTRLCYLDPPVVRTQRKVQASRSEINDAPQGAGLDLVESCPLSISGPTWPNYDHLEAVYNSIDTGMPERQLPLEVYVRPDARATEKFVEKEYEVLDWNGEAVKGKKARRALRVGREGSGAHEEEEEIREEDGFELV